MCSYSADPVSGGRGGRGRGRGGRGAGWANNDQGEYTAVVVRVVCYIGDGLCSDPLVLVFTGYG